MTSKFTKNSPVQPTPAVCKPPPGELPAPQPPIQETPFSIFMTLATGGTPGPFLLKGLGTALPGTPLTTWRLRLELPPDAAELEIVSIPPYETFTVTLTAIRGILPVDDRTWSDVVPRTVRPFRLPLLTTTGPSSVDFWQVAISC